MTTETDTTPETRFVERLTRLDNGPRAELRRALLQDEPSRHAPIFRFVEPFVGGQSESRRKAYYLVAALFGMAEKDQGAEERRPRISLATAIKRYDYKTADQSDEGMSPVERRFLALLDSDQDELPHRLRQIIRMLTTGAERISQPLDWAELLRDLVGWNYDTRSTQTRWAKVFYRTQKDDNKPEEETP
jgi:CRISPR system Cascade subunit CasB